MKKNNLFIPILMISIGCSSVNNKNDNDESLVLITSKKENEKLKTKDTVHIALSTDKRLLKKVKIISNSEIIKPVEVLIKEPEIKNIGEIKVKDPKVKLGLDTIMSKGSSIGTFQKIEWGDYANVKISSPKGDRSFFLKGGPPLLMGELQEKLKGKMIRVSWVKVRRYVPELKESLVVVETEDICSFSNIDIKSKLSRGLIKICKD